MKVHYKCVCVADEVVIDVPDRVPGSDIIVWMGCVTQCIGYDHSARSPRCLRDKMEYAKFAAPEGVELGTKPVVN